MGQMTMGQIATEQQVSSQQASIRRTDRAYRTARKQVNRGYRTYDGRNFLFPLIDPPDGFRRYGLVSAP